MAKFNLGNENLRNENEEPIVRFGAFSLAPPQFISRPTPPPIPTISPVPVLPPRPTPSPTPPPTPTPTPPRAIERPDLGVSVLPGVFERPTEFPKLGVSVLPEALERPVVPAIRRGFTALREGRVAEIPELGVSVLPAILEMPERQESKLKDIADAFVKGVAEIGHGAKQFFTTIFPATLIRDVEEGEMKSPLGFEKPDLTTGFRYTKEEAEEVNTRNRVKRELLLDKYEKGQERFDAWLEANPQLKPRKKYEGSALELIKKDKKILLDPAFWATKAAETIAFTLGIMATSAGTLAITRNPMTALFAGTATALPVVAEDLFNDLIQSGATMEKAIDLTKIVSPLIAGVETVGDFPILAAVSPAFKKILFRNIGKEVAKQVAKATAGNTIGGVLWQGLRTFGVIEATEALEEAIQQGIQNATVRTVDENRGLLEGVGEAAVGALIATAPLSIFGGGSRILTKENRKILKEDFDRKIEKTRAIVADERGAIRIPGKEPEPEPADWEKGLERPFSFDPNSTANEGRFRLLSPDKIKEKTFFRRKSATEGVSYVVGRDAETDEETIQAIRFNKNILSEAEAKKWWEDNKGRFEFAEEIPPLIPEIVEGKLITPMIARDFVFEVKSRPEAIDTLTASQIDKISELSKTNLRKLAERARRKIRERMALEVPEEAPLEPAKETMTINQYLKSVNAPDVFVDIRSFISKTGEAVEIPIFIPERQNEGFKAREEYVRLVNLGRIIDPSGEYSKGSPTVEEFRKREIKKLEDKIDEVSGLIERKIETKTLKIELSKMKEAISRIKRMPREEFEQLMEAERMADFRGDIAPFLSNELSRMSEEARKRNLGKDAFVEKYGEDIVNEYKDKKKKLTPEKFYDIFVSPYIELKEEFLGEKIPRAIPNRIDELLEKGKGILSANEFGKIGGEYRKFLEDEGIVSDFKHPYVEGETTQRPFVAGFGCDGAGDANAHYIAQQMVNALGWDYFDIYNRAYKDEKGNEWVERDLGELEDVAQKDKKVSETTIIPENTTIQVVLDDLYDINNRSLVIELEEELAKANISADEKLSNLKNLARTEVPERLVPLANVMRNIETEEELELPSNINRSIVAILGKDVEGATGKAFNDAINILQSEGFNDLADFFNFMKRLDYSEIEPVKPPEPGEPPEIQKPKSAEEFSKIITDRLDKWQWGRTSDAYQAVVNPRHYADSMLGEHEIIEATRLEENIGNYKSVHEFANEKVVERLKRDIPIFQSYDNKDLIKALGFFHDELHPVGIPAFDDPIFGEFEVKEIPEGVVADILPILYEKTTRLEPIYQTLDDYYVNVYTTDRLIATPNEIPKEDLELDISPEEIEALMLEGVELEKTPIDRVVDDMIAGRIKIRLPEATKTEWKEVIGKAGVARMTSKDASPADDFADTLGITEDELREKVETEMRKRFEARPTIPVEKVPKVKPKKIKVMSEEQKILNDFKVLGGFDNPGILIDMNEIGGYAIPSVAELREIVEKATKQERKRAKAEGKTLEQLHAEALRLLKLPIPFKEGRIIRRNESVLLKAKIRSIARGFREARRMTREQIQKSQNKLITIIRALPIGKQGKFLVAVRNATNEIALREELSRVKEEIKKIEKANYLSRLIKKKRGKIAYLTSVWEFNQTAINDIKKALEIVNPISQMTDSELDKMIKGIEERIKYKEERGLVPATERANSPKPELSEADYALNSTIDGGKLRIKPRERIKKFQAGSARYLGAISSRLQNISPFLKKRLRRFEFDYKNNNRKDYLKIKPFFDKTEELSRGVLNRFDLALKNGDTKVINEIVDENNLREEYEKTKLVLNSLYKRMEDVGIKEKYEENYFPRVLKDTKGLMEFLRRERNWSEINNKIIAKENEIGRNLSENERAIVANNIIRGYAPNRGLIIDKLDPELNRFYYNSFDALYLYFERMNEAIATRKFFGEKKDEEFNNLSDSIGAFVARRLANNEITPDQEYELSSILQSRFGYSGGNRVIGGFRNIGYIASMGSVLNAITQVGDIADSLYKAGFKRTMKVFPSALKTIVPEKINGWIVGDALNATLKGLGRVKKNAIEIKLPQFRKDEEILDLKDLGLERISAEFTTKNAIRNSQKVLDYVFKKIGLVAVDRLGANTFIRSVLGKFQEQARENPEELRPVLEEVFETEEEMEEVLEDLKRNYASENVKLLIFNQILDIQPRALSEMPEKYLNSPNGRIFYMLKSWTLRKLDVYRNLLFRDLLEGARMMKSKDVGTRTEGKQKVKIALRDTFRLTFFLVLMGTTADTIKEIMMFRFPIDLSDEAIENIFKIFGLNRYMAYQLKRDGITEAVENLVFPPISFIDDLYFDVKDLWTDTDEMKKWSGYRSLSNVPFLGRLSYWWFGKGAVGRRRNLKSIEKIELDLDLGIDLDLDLDLEFLK